LCIVKDNVYSQRHCTYVVLNKAHEVKVHVGNQGAKKVGNRNQVPGLIKLQEVTNYSSDYYLKLLMKEVILILK